MVILIVFYEISGWGQHLWTNYLSIFLFTLVFVLIIYSMKNSHCIIYRELCIMYKKYIRKQNQKKLLKIILCPCCFFIFCQKNLIWRLVYIGFMGGVIRSWLDTMVKSTGHRWVLSWNSPPATC